MTTLVTQIRADAKRLRQLNARIGETLKGRSVSPKGRAAWEAACAAFHAEFDDLSYPGGNAGWEAFVSGSSSDVEPALAYLEADPWSFRSGYHKQVIWKRFKQIFLTSHELDRLENVALAYLAKRVRWEFWHMAKFVRIRGSSAFWCEVEALASNSARTPISIKATWLLLIRRNEPVRQRVGMEILKAKHEPGHVAKTDLHVPNNEA